MKANLYLEENNIMARVIMDDYKPSGRGKKTSQGMGRNTKFSHKGSKKRYVKRYKGQGK